MKLWRFFKKDVDPNNIDEFAELDLKTKYPLYATTTNKSKAKAFMKQRNMDLFIVRVSEIEQDEYIEYIHKQGARGTDLVEKELLTIRNKYTDDAEDYQVSMMLTLNEKTIVDEPYFMMDDEWWLSCAPHPLIFNKRLRKALKMIDYNTIYKLITTDPDERITDMDCDIPSPDWVYDEVGVFIALSGETLKLKD